MACGAGDLAAPSTDDFLVPRLPRPAVELFGHFTHPWKATALVLARLGVFLGGFVLPALVGLLIYQWTGSIGLGLTLLMSTVIALAVWVVLPVRLRLHPRGRRRRLRAVHAPALPASRAVLRGTARALHASVRSHLDDKPCLASAMRVRGATPDDLFLEDVRAAELLVVVEDGRAVRVGGVVALRGAPSRSRPARLAREDLTALGVGRADTVPGTIDTIVVRDGDAISVHGEVQIVPDDTGYRGGGTMERIVGEPGRVVVIERLDNGAR